MWPGQAEICPGQLASRASSRDRSTAILARRVLKAPFMSEGLNKVLLFGNLGADPELRMTATGKSVCNIRLATSESWFDAGTQSRQERTSWHDVVIWGKRGDALARILSKGSRVLVEGRLHTSSYEKDGQKRYKTEVVAENVFLAAGRRFEPSDAALPSLPPPLAADQGPDEIPF